MRLALALLPLVLLACSPRGACLDAATRELRRVDLLVAEAEAAQARGYRLERQVGADRFGGVGVGLCTGRNDVLLCTGTRDRVFEREVAVPVDPQAQARVLANLRARQAALRQQATAAIAACPV